MRRIILDTNILMIPGQFKIDVFSEIRRVCDFSYHVYIVDKSVDELKKLASGKSRHAKAAKLGLSLMRAKGVGVIQTNEQGHTDDLIVSIVQKGDIVATQDMHLKRRVRGKGADIITMRQKKRLVLI
ncbi:nucleotide-binding protein [Candidatus Woesearchaeota archaeon]|nr:nucleotide-binding protein [Candidatus Woesearchaeota archaeon]